MFDLALAGAKCKNAHLLRKIANLMEHALQDSDETVFTAFKLEFIEPLAYGDDRQNYARLHASIRDVLGPVAKRILAETEQYLREDAAMNDRTPNLSEE